MQHRPWLFGTALVAAIGAWSSNHGDAIALTRSRSMVSHADAAGGAGRPAPREITVRARTVLDVRLATTVASNLNRPEDPVRGTLASPLIVDGITVAPAGSVVGGMVTHARSSAKVKGRAELTLRFNTLRANGRTYDLDTAPLYYVAQATKGEDAAKISIGAAAGAIVGGIANGGKGAAIGSAIGGGGGTAVVLATAGKNIRLGVGRRLRVRLTQSLRMSVPSSHGVASRSNFRASALALARSSGQTV